MLQTVGELKAWLSELPDDMPVWIGDVVVEGGLEYFSRVRKYEVDIGQHTETFGIMLPKDKQRTETGVVFF